MKMKIRLSQLLAIEPNFVHNIKKNPHFAAYTSSNIVDLLNKYAKEFAINTPLRWAHYIAQVMHESGGFRYSEEIADGSRYEGRKDLGNIYIGDGKKYKGRGLIQLTGRANYVKYRAYCGFDVVKDPTLLSKPIGAIRSSMWFFNERGLNELSDKDNLVQITKRVNGGTNGFENRLRYLNNAKKVLIDKEEEEL